jgi:ribonuclease M5
MKIRELIVVEGIHDLNKLKTVIDAEIIITHGLHLSDDVLVTIKENVSTRGVIVFTDPDTPGDLIRQRISEACPEVKHAHLKSKDARHKRKVGIEHASSESILQALSTLYTLNEFESDLTYGDLYELGLSGHPQSQALRNQVAEVFHLSDVNTKKLYARLCALGIQKSQLMDIIQLKKID